MGVVRREGDWRLKKQDDGIYEVTHKERPELKIITSDYSQCGLVDMTVPVREADSYSEAESIFEEMARGAPPTGGGKPLSLDLADEDVHLSDVPPVGLLLVGLVVGGFLIAESGLAVGSPMFLIGGAFLLLPLGVGVLTYRVYAEEGAGAAVGFLLTTEEDGESSRSGSGDDGVEKTPPAPESLRSDLYFERAGGQCEWCGEDIDSHDTHHIKPRAEGGPNEPENLIVLCPNCHRKADNGMISRSKLRRRVSDQMEDWERETV